MKKLVSVIRENVPVIILILSWYLLADTGKMSSDTVHICVAILLSAEAICNAIKNHK